MDAKRLFAEVAQREGLEKFYAVADARVVLKEAFAKLSQKHGFQAARKMLTAAVAKCGETPACLALKKAAVMEGIGEDVEDGAEAPDGLLEELLKQLEDRAMYVVKPSQLVRLAVDMSCEPLANSALYVVTLITPKGLGQVSVEVTYVERRVGSKKLFEKWVLTSLEEVQIQLATYRLALKVSSYAELAVLVETLYALFLRLPCLPKYAAAVARA